MITGRDGDDFIKASSARISVAMLERHLTNILAGLYSLAGTPPDVAIVENLVQSSPPALAKYSFQGVPDIRIVVFQGYPVMAMLRLATTASDGKANLHQGGAVGVGLDIGSGQSLNAVQFNRPITLHPDTGLALENIRIEDWENMLEMAARCYEATGLGYMGGVDLVVDANEGPLLLELTPGPDWPFRWPTAAACCPDSTRSRASSARTSAPPESERCLPWKAFPGADDQYLGIKKPELVWLRFLFRPADQEVSSPPFAEATSSHGSGLSTSPPRSSAEVLQ